MKRTIKLNENELRRIITETLAEAVSYGWEVGNNEVNEAYELGCEHFGKDKLNSMIVETLSTDELAKSLAFIFRMYDFREWDERNNSEY